MIKTRLAEFKDEAQLFGLVRAFPTPSPIGTDAYISMLQRKLTDPCSFIAVAEQGETLVGYVSGYKHSAFYAAGDTAWVDEILVLNSERRSGVGRLLMAAFESWAVNSGCKLASLATAGAADFYLALGYSTKAGYFKRYLGS
ncbi:MAG: GNAT family N-acetyltransferase [Polycyclovorans sp.]|jgi:GNAT superfamily N-acetyltransferase|nr:GNAT family N-acetyltransferase [Polycyclovorans sp.]|tara:strand:+ start:246 stop:671 length:426 start_codon:yes stop_codon:yes gene_type:complete